MTNRLRREGADPRCCSLRAEHRRPCATLEVGEGDPLWLFRRGCGGTFRGSAIPLSLAPGGGVQGCRGTSGLGPRRRQLGRRESPEEAPAPPRQGRSHLIKLGRTPPGEREVRRLQERQPSRWRGLGGTHAHDNQLLQRGLEFSNDSRYPRRSSSSKLKRIDLNRLVQILLRVVFFAESCIKTMPGCLSRVSSRLAKRKPPRHPFKRSRGELHSAFLSLVPVRKEVSRMM